MPTVLRDGPWRVVIYPNDHRPAHVHVIGKGEEAVYDLHCPKGPPELRENFGCSKPQLSRIRALLVANLAALCASWRAIHEDY